MADEDLVDPERISEIMASRVASMPHVEKGVLSFNGSKWARVDFSRSFSVHPVVHVGLLNSSAPGYSVTVARTHFSISFEEEWTGSISWRAEI